MVEFSVSISVLGGAAGIADAVKLGPNANVVAANPIKKSRFINLPPVALSIWISFRSSNGSIRR